MSVHISTTNTVAQTLAECGPGDDLDFGVLEDGTAVRLHAIGLPGGPVARLIDYGASLQGLRVPFPDGADEVVLGMANARAYEHGGGYLGAVVGRYANRIAGARFRLDGAEVHLDANEGRNTLHGGRTGFSHTVWTLARRRADQLEFVLTSPDGEGGFPGELHVSARYSALPDGLALDLRATTDRTTVVCLTSHSYLQLSSALLNRCDDLLVQIPASRYVPIDAESIPRGGLAPVEGTAFDFRRPALLGARVRADEEQIGLAGGIDHSFDVDGSGLRMMVRLDNPSLGRRLEVWSDQPGAQVYTANYLDGSNVDPGGRRMRQGSGLAVEPQVHPDTPNRPQLGSARLEAGQDWSSRIEWHATTF